MSRARRTKVLLTRGSGSGRASRTRTREDLRWSRDDEQCERMQHA